ncbi:relaxase domain-containing protein [Antribacter gilvus]|uniref:relaxase domain-containing protein n=1 Tax=Antribacter gilvus TaxID=2304675 RepID=UPI000F793CBD
MSAGNGYEYLVKSVRNADLDAPAPPLAEGLAGSWVDPVAAYYAEAGTPPGFWLGAAVQDLGHGELAPGDAVTATHLQRLLGAGVDPIGPGSHAAVPAPRRRDHYPATEARDRLHLRSRPSGRGAAADPVGRHDRP